MNRALITIITMTLSLVMSAQAGVELISQPHGMKEKARRGSRFPSLSRDGRFVAFSSRARLVENDTNTDRDIYIYDRKMDIMQVVPSPDPGRSNSGPCMSKRGLYIAYHSYPEGVVKRTIPRMSDIFVYGRLTGRNEYMDVTVDGGPANGEALFPCPMNKKRYVLFTSNATNLMEKTEHAVRGIYVFDTRNKKTELVSQSDSGEPANRLSGIPRVSDDGRYVAFKSVATNLVEDTPAASLTHHLYFVDRKRKSIIQIDTFERGFDSENWVVGRFDMDRHGNLIVMEVRSKWRINFDLGYDHTQIFLYDHSIGLMEQITPHPFQGRVHNPSMSEDGRYIAFVASGDSPKSKEVGLVIFDREQDQWQWAAKGHLQDPVISGDGSVVAFESKKLTHIKGARRGVMNVFVAENPFY